MLKTIETYLALRRATGFAMSNAEYLLKSFAGFAAERGQAYVQTQTAIDWAALGPSIAQRDARLKAVYRFARHIRIEDVRHELPPGNHFGARKRRRSPHIYSGTEIARLIETAGQLRPQGSLRPLTYATLIALLAATGLRIKGTMSEAELHILKARMHEGRCAKARRGELFLGLPRGYVLKPSGEVALDPDEGVQRAIRLVFAVFERRRSISGVLRYLVDHDLQLPDRVRSGPNKGDVCWNRPNRATLSDMLRHPAYAGAYAFGRRHYDGRRRLPGKPHSGRSYLSDPQKWMVLHQDALPAYIDWSHFERNQRQMAMNRSRHMGVPRGGAALLSGLISCGLCGRRMFTTYTDDGREARYVCHQLPTTYGEARCQSISAWPVDRLTSTLILEALLPAAIEVSLQASEDIELERRQRRPAADRECRSVSRGLCVVTYWVSLLPIMPRRTRKS